jgi:hypothetical protein
MARYSIAAVVGILYAALACWVVRSEGEAYREALRRERAAATARAPASEPTRSNAEPLATAEDRAPATPAIGPLAEAPAEPTPAPAPKAEPAAGRAEGKARAPRRSQPRKEVAVRTAPAVPSEAPDGRPAPTFKDNPPAVAPATKPGPLPAPNKPLSEAAVWANGLDLSRLKHDDERRLGAELHAMVMAVNTPLDRGLWLQRVVMAARPLLEARSRKEIDYHFTVLDSDAVDAFSLPGGYVYVCRGLFDLIGEDEGYALEFVLGHEIAHVDLGHALKCVAPGNEASKKRGVDTLTQFFTPVAMGYPDQQEFEADAWAYRQMVTRLDRTRRQCLAFLRKFQGYAETHDFVNGRKAPKPGTSLVENHFAAHPAAWDRLERLKSVLTTRAGAPAPAPAKASPR